MSEKLGRIAKRLAFPSLIAIVVCAFFHRTFLGDRFFASDFYQTFVPLRTLLTEAWAHGLPLWTGRLGNGSPILANPAYAALYPPNLVYLGTNAARAMTVLTVAHFVGGGIGAAVLARRFAMSGASAWTAAIAFALSGAAVSSTAYPNLSWPLAWLPWAIVAHDTARGGRVRCGIAGLAIVWFSMLSLGEPVVLAAALLGSALLVLHDVFRPLPDRSRLASLTRSFVPAAGAGLLALALASPLLVAVFKYFPATVRASGFKAEAIVLWSFHPLLLAGVVLPNPFGDPSLAGPAGFWASALAIDRPRPLLAGVYVGGLLVALALLGALRRSAHRGTLLVWLLLLVALALGKYGPIYPLAGDTHGFDALRYPTKWIVPAMLPLALLAASGLDALRTGPSPSAGSRRGPMVLLFVLTLLAAVSLASMTGLERVLGSLAAQPGLRIDGVPIALHARDTWLWASARSAAPLALALLAVVFLPRTRAGAAALPLVAALATLDVALANRSLAPTVASSFYDAPRAAEVILADPLGHERVFIDDDAFASRPVQDASVEGQRQTLASYVGAAAGLSLAFSLDTEAFAPFAYARAGVLVRGAPLREKLMLAGAAGATHIVTPLPPNEAAMEPLATISGPGHVTFYIYRNPTAVPRARVVPRLTPYGDDAELIRAVRSASVELFRTTALVDRRELASSGLAADASSAEGGEATVVSENDRSLVLRTEGPGGFLVVSDTFAPGWSARVDGSPAPLVMVDLAFRATPVPAGVHRVEMCYDPW